MINLEIEETSGVDHPAHLHEGWLVVKAANATTVADVLRTLPESMEASMSEATEEIVEQETVAAAEDMPEQEAKEVEEDLAMAMARIAELEARISELEGMVEVEVDDEEKMEGEEMMEEAVVALAKSASADVRKALVDMAKAKAQAENALIKEREDRADAEAITKARETFKHLNLDVEKVAPALRRLDAALAKSIEDALIAADAQNESADIFTEVGKGYAPQGDAIDRMTSLAKAAVVEGKAATFEQALSNVAMENPALYNDYLIEKGA
jgi:hypothetical protein